jgi:hypothetical protein
MYDLNFSAHSGGNFPGYSSVSQYSPLKVNRRFERKRRRLNLHGRR